MFIKKKKKFKTSRILLLLTLAIFILLISFGIYRILMVKPPIINGYDSLTKLPLKKEVKLQVDSNSQVKFIEIEIIQGYKEFVILKDEPGQRHKEYTIVVNPKQIGLKDGEAEVVIKAGAGLFSETEHLFPTIIDTVPPVISVVDNSYLAKQGSAGAALIKADGADIVYIKLGDNTYTASNAITGSENLYFVLFPVDLDLPADSTIYAVSEDRTGNKAIAYVSTRIRKTKINKPVMNISDRFIEKIIYSLIGEDFKKLSPEDAFIQVNETMRNNNENKIKEICKKSSEEMLWDGKFLQMHNSKVFSNFGELRSYEYNNKIISKSRHMGYDLASIRNAQVEVSNSGIIAFAGDLGIYGNTVIIDHGIGLMSMYAHLSSISVTEGQRVEKSSVIGRSGMTGLAGGDHLHFAILVHGVYVSPLPWWDKNWVEKRIINILNSTEMLQ